MEKGNSNIGFHYLESAKIPGAIGKGLAEALGGMPHPKETK